MLMRHNPRHIGGVVARPLRTRPDAAAHRSVWRLMGCLRAGRTSVPPEQFESYLIRCDLRQRSITSQHVKARGWQASPPADSGSGPGIEATVSCDSRAALAASANDAAQLRAGTSHHCWPATLDRPKCQRQHPCSAARGTGPPPADRDRTRPRTAPDPQAPNRRSCATFLTRDNRGRPLQGSSLHPAIGNSRCTCSLSTSAAAVAAAKAPHSASFSLHGEIRQVVLPPSGRRSCRSCR